MSGHRPFSQLTKDWSPARNDRVEKRKADLLRDIKPRRGKLDLVAHFPAGDVRITRLGEPTD